MKRHIDTALQSSLGRFMLVGVINTGIDFGILNILTQLTDLDRIPANIVSASFAMVFSFFANRAVVFRSNGDKTKQAALFILVTVTSIYIVQNVIIYFLGEVWRWPLETAYDIIPLFDIETFITNASKVAATVGSLVWNFLLYRSVVFADSTTKESNDE